MLRLLYTPDLTDTDQYEVYFGRYIARGQELFVYRNEHPLRWGCIIPNDVLMKPQAEFRKYIHEQIQDGKKFYASLEPPASNLIQ